ncbi:MAG: hypothetical protein Q9209_002569 [Squamulea sp. 1 TL-2023]
MYYSGGHGFALEYYTNDTKKTISKDVNLRGPVLWYAALLHVPSNVVTNKTLMGYANITSQAYKPNGNYSVAQSMSTPSAVWIENGEYANAVLSFRDGFSSITTTWTKMNQTASLAFTSSFRLLPEAGLAQFQREVQEITMRARSPGGFAKRWASAVDQAILSSGDGMYVGRPPLSSITRSTTAMQVTRIPRAPFITLIVLNLLYATIGTYLMILALIAVRKGHGVRDAQARLSTLAVVAESFENPAYGDDARDVDMLFAERRGRGESIRRIALVRRAGGGRRFKQLVVPKNYVKGSSSTTSGSSMQGSSVSSSS